jgi:hypothetical protein
MVPVLKEYTYLGNRSHRGGLCPEQLGQWFFRKINQSQPPPAGMDELGKVITLVVKGSRICGNHNMVAAQVVRQLFFEGQGYVLDGL